MILVTGGSEGIGLACTQALLARTDAPLLITGRTQAKLDRAHGDLPSTLRERLCTMACDQSRPDHIDALLARLGAMPQVEGAVLTVGVNPMYTEGPQRLHSLDAQTIQDTVRTNCTHTALLSAALLDRLRRQRSGVVVWIGSRAAAAGLPGAAIYCATKSFLSGLARAARNEYGRCGIRVHVVHPGVVRTPRTAPIADAFAARHGLRVAELPDVARQIVDLFLDGNADAVEVDLQ